MFKKVVLVVCMLLGAWLLSGCDAAEFDAASEIKVYTRDTTSGTRDGFFTGIELTSAIKDNSVLKMGYIEVAGNGDIINGVKNDVYGIGYISLSSLENSGLIGLSFEGAEPTEANVINGTYGLKRNFNYMVRTSYQDARIEELAMAFVAYMQTVEGKATIQNNDGIIDIGASDPSWEDIKENYPVTAQDNSDLTVKLGGSNSVLKIAQALSNDFKVKAGNFVAEHNHTGSGDAFLRAQGSEKDGPNQIHIGFASREFKTEETINQGTFGVICKDAIVVVVHPSNTVITNITKHELRMIYQGQKNTWNSLS